MFNETNLHIFFGLIQFISVPLVFIFLLISVFKKNDQMFKTCLVTNFILGLLASICYFLGQPAMILVQEFPGVKDGVVDIHESTGQYLLFAMIFYSVVCLFGFKLYKNTKYKILVSVIGLAVVIYSSYACFLGLNVRHTETRNIKQNFEKD